METPSIVSVRIVRIAKTLPANITLLLPGMPEPEGVEPPHIVLRVEFPDMEPYHACLGRFLDEWGKLEIQLRLLFKSLLGTDHSRAMALSAGLSGKALTDALVSLADVALAQADLDTFIVLTERLKSLTQRRNYLIHGYWMAEIIAFNQRNGDVTFKLKVVREYPPTSSRAREALANPKNQRERAKYVFQRKRIDQIAANVAALRDDLAAFMKTARMAPAQREL
ncbi:MAG: hypothetical protein RDV41_14875 [Planctomycetota bacterium]|nr:hypothetical protein [Planctomycetota bacterium]